MIRTLLVDDHASFRQALAYLIDREPDLEVSGQAGTLADAVTLLADAEVAVIDVLLPDGSGLDLIPQFHSVRPDGQALVLAANTDPPQFARSVEAGAGGVLNKAAAVAEIISAIRKLATGEPLMSVGEVMELLRASGRERDQRERIERVAARLTPREREVLQALADGRSNKEIARQLHITIETQRTHMVNILSKLEVHSQLQAVVFAIRNGIVRLG